MFDFGQFLRKVHTFDSLGIGFYLLNRRLMPLGSLIAGMLANYLGGPWAVTIMGISCFLLTIVVSLFAPDLWKSKLISDSEETLQKAV